MHKKDEKTTRSTSFFSKKNGETLTVYSDLARKAAAAFEEDPSIYGYKVNVEMPNLQTSIETRGIAGRYFTTDWVSDFVLSYLDGSTKVIEIADEAELDGQFGRALCMKLEISRRYWLAAGMPDWGVIIMGKGEKANAVPGK